MKRIVPALLLCAGLSVGTAWATVIPHPLNGDFSSGLDDWTAMGDVNEVGGTAVLGDDDVFHSVLYQGVELPPGTYMLMFDFQNLLSDEEAVNAFLDFVSVNLYFIDDLSMFDLENGVFDGALDLMDVQFNVETVHNGTIEASTLGGDWQLFSVTFTNTHNYVIPVFELFNLNGEFGDSQFIIDNVIITEKSDIIIPEPATLVLMGGGLVLLGLRRRRNAAQGMR